MRTVRQGKRKRDDGDRPEPHALFSSALPAMLDVAGHLSSFGWQGHGTALRDGAITRPLLVAQKKSLAGLGKDRDEAFPFWDQCVRAADARDGAR